MKVIVKDINGIEVVKDLDSVIAHALLRTGEAKYPEQKEVFKEKIIKKVKNEKNI